MAGIFAKKIRKREKVKYSYFNNLKFNGLNFLI